MFPVMDFKTNFQELCIDIGEANRKSVLKSVSSASSDRERIELVAKLAELYGVCSPLLLNLGSVNKEELEKPRKISAQSHDYRLKGNDLYKEKLYPQANYLYTQSILLGEGESLALSFANRSVIFYETGDYLHSLRDIQLAIDHNYPKNLEYKLRERQGNCWLKLKDKKQAVISFSLTRDLLVAYPIPDSSKLSNVMSRLNQLGNPLVDVENLVIDVESIEEKIASKRRVPPQIHANANPLIPCASTCVKLSYISGKGRGLIATEDLKPGTTVIVETPFVSFLENEWKNTQCHYCHHWTPAWESFHQHECGLFDLLQRTRVTETTLLALRAVLKTDRKIIKRAQTDVLRIDEVYDSNDYRAIHGLCGHTSKRSGEELFRRSVMAFYFIGLVKGEPDMELSAELLRLLQSFPCNTFGVNQIRLPSASRPINAKHVSSEIIGAAVYPICSLINHSCDPNIDSHNYGNVKVVKVSRPIRKGEEMLISYGFVFLGHPKTSRQFDLKDKYFFDCSCQACMDNWPCINGLQGLPIGHRLLHPILLDLSKYSKHQCHYLQDIKEVEKWRNKFITHLNLIDAERNIRRPVLEYYELIEAMKHCDDLLAATSPMI